MQKIGSTGEEILVIQDHNQFFVRHPSFHKGEPVVLSSGQSEELIKLLPPRIREDLGTIVEAYPKGWATLSLESAFKLNALGLAKVRNSSFLRLRPRHRRMFRVSSRVTATGIALSILQIPLTSFPVSVRARRVLIRALQETLRNRTLPLQEATVRSLHQLQSGRLLTVQPEGLVPTLQGQRAALGLFRD